MEAQLPVGPFLSSESYASAMQDQQARLAAGPANLCDVCASSRWLASHACIMRRWLQTGVDRNTIRRFLRGERVQPKNAAEIVEGCFQLNMDASLARFAANRKE
jgi:hypothetical protein